MEPSEPSSCRQSPSALRETFPELTTSPAWALPSPCAHSPHASLRQRFPCCCNCWFASSPLSCGHCQGRVVSSPQLQKALVGCGVRSNQNPHTRMGLSLGWGGWGRDLLRMFVQHPWAPGLWQAQGLQGQLPFVPVMYSGPSQVRKSSWPRPSVPCPDGT